MNKTRIHAVELILLAALALLLAYGTALERQQQSISGELIRLHVTANSDSPQDQQIKLLVRDAVLEQAQLLLEAVHSRDEAKLVLSENLGSLEETANQALEHSGSRQKARVTLSRELFGTRVYDGFSLPGGYYDALRVNIGSGSGHNWWCVVYPQICTAATTEDRRAVAVMGGLDEEQVAILEADTPEYQFKFRSLELLENILGWFRSGGRGIPVSR